MTLNKLQFNKFWMIVVSLFWLPTFASAQGWEIIEEDTYEVPADMIAPSQGGYLSIGTTILPGTGMVLKLNRIDLEGRRIFSKNYDIIEQTAGQANGYTVNEFQSGNTFLITGPKIGYAKVLDDGIIDWHFQTEQLGLATDDLVISSSTTDDNHAFIVSQGINNSITNTSLVKIAANGIALSTTTINEAYDLIPLSNITTNDGGCAILCHYIDGSETGTAIVQSNANGVVQWIEQYQTLNAIKRTLVEDEVGNLFFVDDATGDNRVYQVDAVNTDNISLLKTVPQNIMFTAAKLMLDLENNFVLTGHRVDNGMSHPTLMKFGSNGDEIWTREHQVADEATIIATTIDKESKIVSHGQYSYASSADRTAYRLSIDSNGDIYENFITGNVYYDLNSDCANNGGDFPLSNWLVKADGAVDFYGLANENGNYSIPVPVGSYEVTISSPSEHYNECTPSYSIVATDQPAVFELDFGMQPDFICSYLQVEVSVPILRFCYEQVYYVDYCNYGTEAATNASVSVVLDDLLTFQSASPIAPIAQANNTFNFEIPGTIEVGECGQFTITTQLTCEEDNIGTTACVEATIFPQCDEPVNPIPHLRVEGFCLEDTDSIEFQVINDGTGPLVSARSFIVIEDNVIMDAGVINDNIQVGGSISRRFPANIGKTLNFSIEQASVFPTMLGDPYATATVEGCVGFPSAPYTYSNFADDDGEVWIAGECNEIVSSYDPNDKQVIPNGVEEIDHFILPNQTMEYKVRFQNTGTDTAFLVVIRDTISEHLDLQSFIPGASSHPYRYEILNDGYLKFTFENIMLPDSTTNEVASNGFIKYTIRQKPDLPEGTRFENCAAIYFDFNSPVITNCTWNTIRYLENWVVSNEVIPSIDIKEVKVYPNPFTEFVNFEIVSDNPEYLYNEKQFKLYNSTGKLLHLENFEKTTYRFYKKNIPAGIYYYEIQQDGSHLNSGKLIIQ